MILQGYNNQKVWYWHKNKYTDQWKKTENMEISLWIYNQLFYDNGAKRYNGERRVSSVNGAGTTRQPHGENETGPLLHHAQRSTQSGLKTWMQDLKP